MTHTPNNIRVEQVSMREKFARVVAWHCYGPWESLQSGFREKDRCLRIADELLAFLSSTRPSDEIVALLKASDAISIGPNGSGGTRVLVNFDAGYAAAEPFFRLLSDATMPDDAALSTSNSSVTVEEEKAG